MSVGDAGGRLGVSVWCDVLYGGGRRRGCFGCGLSMTISYVGGRPPTFGVAATCAGDRPPRIGYAEAAAEASAPTAPGRPTHVARAELVPAPSSSSPSAPTARDPEPHPRRHGVRFKSLRVGVRALRQAVEAPRCSATTAPRGAAAPRNRPAPVRRRCTDGDSNPRRWVSWPAGPEARWWQSNAGPQPPATPQQPPSAPAAQDPEPHPRHAPNCASRALSATLRARE